jgi:hypothetical protein
MFLVFRKKMDDTDMLAPDLTVTDESPIKKKKSIREAVQENEKEVVGIRNISAIRSKIRRNQEWVRLKKDKKKEKRKRQDDRRKVKIKILFLT